jgi:hypothetical protein
VPAPARAKGKRAAEAATASAAKKTEVASDEEAAPADDEYELEGIVDMRGPKVRISITVFRLLLVLCYFP